MSKSVWHMPLLTWLDERIDTCHFSPGMCHFMSRLTWQVDQTFNSQNSHKKKPLMMDHPFKLLLILLKYTILSKSSQPKGNKLCDSLGFTYVSLYTCSNGVKKWRCATYIEVFHAVDTLLPTRNVQTITLDFEAAMWQAAEVFPIVAQLGCFFHWSQAIWWKVQELGLQRAYISDEKTHAYIRQLLSLPYLPCEHIAPIFERLEAKAVTQPLQELTTYITTT